ncbi:hypothetical protein ACHAXS_014025 [Conticribra weissflogii]
MIKRNNSPCTLFFFNCLMAKFWMQKNIISLRITRNNIIFRSL